MKQYDSYKDSGVEWIGEVPSHWEVRKTSLAFMVLEAELLLQLLRKNFMMKMKVITGFKRVI